MWLHHLTVYMGTTHKAIFQAQTDSGMEWIAREFHGCKGGFDIISLRKAAKGSAWGWGRRDVCCHRAASYKKTVWPACDGVADLIRKSDKLSFSTLISGSSLRTATEAARCPHNSNTIDKSHFCHSFPQCAFAVNQLRVLAMAHGHLELILLWHAHGY